MPNIKKSTKYFIFVVLVLIAILAVYWVKSQLGFSISKKHSLSTYFPISYLKRDYVTEDPEPGIILHDSFDSWRLMRNWTELWMREKDSVFQFYDSEEEKNLRYLKIENRSDGSWSISHNKYVEVNKDDVFSIRVQTRLKGSNLSTWAGVSLFDMNQEVVSWNFGTGKTVKTDEWITLQNTFTIPEGVAFVQFRLAGVGKGEFWYDDVRFSKE